MAKKGHHLEPESLPGSNLDSYCLCALSFCTCTVGTVMVPVSQDRGEASMRLQSGTCLINFEVPVSSLQLPTVALLTPPRKGLREVRGFPVATTALGFPSPASLPQFCATSHLAKEQAVHPAFAPDGKVCAPPRLNTASRAKPIYPVPGRLFAVPGIGIDLGRLLQSVLWCRKNASSND